MKEFAFGSLKVSRMEQACEIRVRIFSILLRFTRNVLADQKRAFAAIGPV